MEEPAWILQFLGRLHPLVVHFPIGLLLVALFMEVFSIGNRRPSLRDGINWIVYLGAFFGILSAILGWFLQSSEDYSGELVQWHQNMGIATVVLATITAFLLLITQKGKFSNFLVYRFGLATTVIALTITGHFGASLTHGEDYLSGALPGNQSSYDNSKALALMAEINSADSLSETQLDALNLEVRAVLAHNCYQCHSENKQKGKLILENKRGVFNGGESGPILVAYKPEESEIYRRITLPSNHDEVMPKKGKVLKAPEIALIELWIKNGAHWADRALKVFPEAPLALSKPSLPKPGSDLHPVDQLMDIYFKEHKIKWPQPVDDQIFIRRAYLDITGLLPAPSEVAHFVKDTKKDKRNALIDELLNDNHSYTQHWLSFWNDLLRNDYSGTGFITGGRKQITEWLYQSLLENKPYHLMVQELVNPTEASEGFIKGIQWRGVVNASQRTEMQAAQNIGQSLMGMNLKCASCHNSFVSNLTLEQAYGFASLFADSTLELNRCDKPLGKMAKVNFLYSELGSVEAETIKERLIMLSEVIVKPENGRLYRTITNRIWQKLMGRGIIEPVDEMDNTPWNGDLLDWLASDFIDSGYNLKHLMRGIMSSKAYQLPSINFAEIAALKSDKFIFKGPGVRRLSAEQFCDAVSQIVAPVYRATAFDPDSEGLSANRIWHRELKFDRDVLPEPGKRYFRYKFLLPTKEMATAKALISVDHSYKFFVNGNQVLKGTNWKKVGKVDIKNWLKTGSNVIAIEGNNEGTVANPAGILFALKIQLEDGEEIVVQSGKDWKSTDGSIGNDWTNSDYDDTNWKEARNYGSRHWDKLVNFQFKETENQFARASLVRQHPFMKALGRPTRENVATTRDQQATLLQALELTNGDYFNNVLEEGAGIWLEEFDNTEAIAETLYQRSFGRNPSDDEKATIMGALGKAPDKEALQDLFWATLLLPEFQYIH